MDNWVWSPQLLSIGGQYQDTLNELLYQAIFLNSWFRWLNSDREKASSKTQNGTVTPTQMTTLAR